MGCVLVVEDDPQMRAFFVASVLRCPALQLSASVGSVAQALDWLADHASEIDVLLIDLGLPDGSGLTVIRHAIRLNPAIEPLVISMFGDEDNVLASIEAGALGYIHKDASPDDIAQTILEMKAGTSPISPMIARRVLSKFYKDKNQEKIDTTERLSPSLPGLLTPREQDVLALIARGFSYVEIARLQTLSIHTVQSHIKRIYSKLAVHSKSEAVFEATRMGLISGYD
jgi:DNA-binding NarL/FixJ family response regulator